MIQRIQTLYLLLVTALMTVTLFSRLAWFGGEGSEFGLYAFALKDAAGATLHSTVYLGILLVAGCFRSGCVWWRWFFWSGVP